MNNEYVILGSGMAGLGAAAHLRAEGRPAMVFDKKVSSSVMSSELKWTHTQ